MEIVCSAVAGITARLICHPLDTIKTVAFTGFAGEQGGTTAAAPPSNTSPRSPFLSAVKKIWKNEGIKGFYRGIGVTALGSAPGVALYLTSYDYTSTALMHCKSTYGSTATSSSSTSSSDHPLFYYVIGHTPQPVLYFIAGFIAEAVSCVFWVPIDVTKERLQSQPPSLTNRYRNSWDALRTIHRHEGVLGLYKGYFSTLGSFGPFSAVYFVSYEFFQDQLRRLIQKQSPNMVLDRREDNSTWNNFMIALVSGGISNTVASLCTNPLELVKTRLQVQRAVLERTTGEEAQRLYHYHYRGLWDGLTRIAKEEGVRGLWRGVWCRAAFTTPNAALTMSFFELLKAKYVKQK